VGTAALRGGPRTGGCPPVDHDGSAPVDGNGADEILIGSMLPHEALVLKERVPIDLRDFFARLYRGADGVTSHFGPGDGG
jgi:hypothetical protein